MLMHMRSLSNVTLVYHTFTLCFDLDQKYPYWPAQNAAALNYLSVQYKSAKFQKVRASRHPTLPTSSFTSLTMPKDESNRSSRRHGHRHRDRDRDAPYHKEDRHRRHKDHEEDEFGRSKPSRRHPEGSSSDAHHPSPSSSHDTSPCPTFDSMSLKPALLRGIYAYGFEKPSAIQQRAIRPIIRGRDVIAQSQSGTGKTAVFSISALQLLDERSSEPQVLILSPIRELAEQTQRVVSSLGDFMNVKAIACIGGKSLGEDRKMLQQGVQIISGTPGRVYDLIKRGDLRTRSLKAFIIDEADEMLNKGFKEQVSKEFDDPGNSLCALCSYVQYPQLFHACRRYMTFTDTFHLNLKLSS
jgi:ATP-dependent helicase YprA (DUF1998 family)